MAFEEWLRGAKITFNEDNLIAQLKIVWEAALKANSQGEPDYWLAGTGDLYSSVAIAEKHGAQKPYMPLYTQAPTIPEGWQLVKTKDIQFCIDAIHDWGVYANNYEAEKWDLAGDIERAKAMLAAPKP